MILLDTDMLSLLFAAHPKVSERFDQVTETVATTVISRIEVLAGRFASVVKAADSQQLLQAQERLRLSEANLTTLTVIAIDAASAAEFDKLRQNKKLKKIGRADLLIACIALAHRATLVTRNLKHFQLIPGLHLENWAD